MESRLKTGLQRELRGEQQFFRVTFVHPNLNILTKHLQGKGCLSLPKRMNFRKSSKRPLTPPHLIFGKSYCRFFKKLYSLKNHTCGIFLKSPGYESIKNNDPCCQIQCLNFKCWAGVVLRIWLKQGREKILLARILKFLEKARKTRSQYKGKYLCKGVTKNLTL